MGGEREGGEEEGRDRLSGRFVTSRKKKPLHRQSSPNCVSC
jgi:hypothetical protein